MKVDLLTILVEIDEGTKSPYKVYNDIQIYIDEQIEKHKKAYAKELIKKKMRSYDNSFVSPSRQAIEREKIEFNVLKQLLKTIES